MNQEKFKKASEKISEIVLMANQEVAVKHIRNDVSDCYGNLLVKYARELIAAVEENAPQTSAPKKSEMPRNSCNSERTADVQVWKSELAKKINDTFDFLKDGDYGVMIVRLNNKS